MKIYLLLKLKIQISDNRDDQIEELLMHQPITLGAIQNLNEKLFDKNVKIILDCSHFNYQDKSQA